MIIRLLHATAEMAILVQHVPRGLADGDVGGRQTMRRSEIILDRDFTIGKTDPRLFGAFVEHIGRCVYGGIYEPGHPSADANGFRMDVMALIRELAPTIVRYPGGNFVSAYRWEDGVGPVAQRPRRLDYAWLSTEPNSFGTNEFINWSREAEIEPMLAVNLGTRSEQEAGDYIEYCNHPGGTALSDLRRSHGWEQPHGVKFWCLGNEMDAPWQVGVFRHVSRSTRRERSTNFASRDAIS